MYVRPDQHDIETASRKLFAMALPNGWQERLDVGGDYGIDDHVEIFNDGKSTGLLLLFQRKGFDETPPTEDVTEIVFDLSVKTLRYAELFSPPVLLALVPVQAASACFYYVWLQEYIRTRLDLENPTWRQNTATVRLRVPTKNRMPGDEGQLTHFAGAPMRDREWAVSARVAHELEYAVEARDLPRVRGLIDDLYRLHSIFGNPSWGWSVWARTQVLDTASAAVDALLRGPPFSHEDLGASGRPNARTRGYESNSFDEHEVATFLLEGVLTLLPGQVGALVATYYNHGLAAYSRESHGDTSY